MPLQFVLSEKNKQKLVDGGCLFIKDKANLEKIFWKCDQYQRLYCKARIHTANDKILKRVGYHSHAGEAGRIEAIKVINEVKHRARTTQDGTHRILTDAFVGLPQAIAGHMPSNETLKKTIRNTRNHAGQAPPNPATLADLQVPLDYQMTHSGNEFLLSDSGNGPDRILIFSTHRNLQLLAQSQTWYADGTFKTVPPLFAQLYTIHCIVNDSVIPAVFALLPHKDEETYNRLLAELINLQPNLVPTMIMTDFEMAAINAFHLKFPNAQQKCCFFHFNQCIYRNIQTNGLQHRYENEADFALKMRMISALAFLPITDIVRGFEQLSEDNYPLEAQPVLDYFEDTWIGRPVRGQRRAPRYNMSLWNCYNAALLSMPKTNNSCEGWHRAFSELIAASHPTIWKFIKALKDEQSLNEGKIEQYIAGAEVPLGKKRYHDTAARIQRIVNDFQNRDILDYLRGLAYNISY